MFRKHLSKFQWFYRGRPWYRLHGKLSKSLGTIYASTKESAEASAEAIGPKVDQLKDLHHSPHEEKIKGAMGQALAEVNRRTDQAIGELATVVQEKAVEIKRLEEEKEERLADLNDLKAKQDEQARNTEQVALSLIAEQKLMLNKKAKDLNRHLKKVRKSASIPKGQPPFRPWKSILVWLAEIIMVVGEYAANKQMIARIFREDGLSSTLFALGISVGAIWLAHQLGVFTAQLSKNRWAKAATALKAGLSLLAVAASLGLLRSMLVGGDGNITEEELGMWAVVGIIGFLPTAAFFLSYFSYDPQAPQKRAFNALKRRLRRINKGLQRLERQHKTAKATLQKALVNHANDHASKTNKIKKETIQKKAKSFKELSAAARAMNITLAVQESFHKSVQAESIELVNHFRSKVIEYLGQDVREIPAWLQAEVSPLECESLYSLDPGVAIGEAPAPLYLSKAHSKKVGPGQILPMLALGLCLAAPLSSCEKSGPSGEHSAIEVLVDRSDSSIVETPAITASILVELSGLQGQEAERPSTSIAFGEIGQSAFGSRSVISLGSEGRENEYDNRDSISVFQNRVEGELSRLYRPLEDLPKQSRLYIGICEALHRLVAVETDRKTLIVNSDFLEHSEVSFYRERRHLEKSSNDLQMHRLQSRLEEQCQLPRLEGIRVYLLASSTGNDDDLIIRARTFFKEFLESKGATVHFNLGLQ